MGSYMHLINRDDNIRVEAYKHSGGGQIINEITEPDNLVNFLEYCHSRNLKIEVVSDHFFCDMDPRENNFTELLNGKKLIK